MDIILKSIDNYLFLYGQHFLSMVFIRMSMGSMGFAEGGGRFVWEGGVRKEEGAAVALTPVEFITTQKSLLHRNEQTFGFPY